ncbi:MAG: autotransporter [Thermoanaerobaculia bacterium]
MAGAVCAALALAFASLPLAAQETAPAGSTGEQSAAAEAAVLVEESDPGPWPRLLEGGAYQVKLHPPQVDDWDGRRLNAHSAVEIGEKGKEGSTYGVVDFTARTRVDKDARLVIVDEYLGIRAQIPAQPEKEARLLGFLQKELNDTVRVVSLDRVETALAATRSGRGSEDQVAVKNEPPELVFAERPTLLVTIDGSPVWRQIEGTTYERLLNTRPLLLRDSSAPLYLHLFDGWLEARKLDGPWQVAGAEPAGIDAASSKAMESQPADLLDGGGADQQEVDEAGEPIEKPTLAKGPVPDIVVATQPTELVVTEGAPKWTAIPGTELEFVDNTTGNVFRLASGRPYYVLLSGRWFEAASLTGPWSFVPQEKLAADFRQIPDDSPKENVKASIAGTPQAEEAVIANSVPQTSEIDREGAEFTPTIDGEPEWEPIESTSLAYAKNSPTPIIRVAPDEYYAVHNGVWFVAPVVTGPWIVAVEVPEVIYSIPASSPLHYVTYVRVYDSDEETVVVGYTPGYYGTVVSDEVVVYGTGYYYTPWVGSYWYGYPATWGYSCGITYTPWGGWSFTFGVGWGWGYWGGWYAPYYPPYWGPYWGYYPWYGGAVVGPGGGWAAWGPGGWAGTTGNIYRQWGDVSTVSRYSGGYNAWTGNAWRGQVGTAYNSRTGTIAAGQRGAVANVYSGEYAYGGRGVAANPNTGTTAAGGRVTVGDADSGRQATAGRVGAVNPGTGQAGSAGWVRGEEGGVARVGDDFYAGKDGSVYKRNDQGDWSQVDHSGQWQSVQNQARTGDLDRQHQARNYGQQRYQGYRMSAPRASAGGFRGGGRRR